MLSKSNNTTIHVKNIEFYKYLYGLLAPTMEKVIQKDSLRAAYEVKE